MARRSRGQGLTAFFGYTAFDLDPRPVREGASRDYLAYRLVQVELWLPYLARRLSSQQQKMSHSPCHPAPLDQAVGAALDVAYLQAVRQALRDALRDR